MAVTFENTEAKDGLTFKLYRGEGMALAAFDLDKSKIDDSFVGFAVEYRPPSADVRPWWATYYVHDHVKERDRKLFIST